MAPRWEADARGAWYGLTPAHGKAHLCRALLEGSAYAFRDVVEAIRGAGLDPRRVVCVAGGARSPLVRQMRADLTGLPVTWSEDVETTSRGAAMLAAAGAGLHAGVADAAAAMSRLSGSEHEPDAAGAELLERGAPPLPAAVRRPRAGLRRARLSRTAGVASATWTRLASSGRWGSAGGS